MRSAAIKILDRGRSAWQPLNISKGENGFGENNPNGQRRGNLVVVTPPRFRATDREGAVSACEQKIGAKRGAGWGEDGEGRGAFGIKGVDIDASGQEYFKTLSDALSAMIIGVGVAGPRECGKGPSVNGLAALVASGLWIKAGGEEGGEGKWVDGEAVNERELGSELIP